MRMEMRMRTRMRALGALLGVAVACGAAAMIAAWPSSAGRTHPGDDAEAPPPRRLTVAVVGSDEHAETVLSVEDDVAPRGADDGAPGLSAREHRQIAAVLKRADGHAQRALKLVQNPDTLAAGQAAMERAEAVFAEAKTLNARALTDGDARQEEDRERALGVAQKVLRHLYEQMTVSGKDTIGFTDCQGRLVKHCKTIITRYLRDHGFLHGRQRINIQTYQKRPAIRDPYDEGANKVVLVIDALGESVAAEPRFPNGWTWNGRAIGPWPACVGASPADCCLTITNDVPDADEAGRLIECELYVPKIAQGDVQYPQVRDKRGRSTNGIILYESVDPNGDARVEETPFIQADFELPP